MLKEKELKSMEIGKIMLQEKQFHILSTDIFEVESSCVSNIQSFSLRI